LARIFNRQSRGACGSARYPVQILNAKDQQELRPSDPPLASSVPASVVGSVDGPAVYWFLENSVYSLIEHLAAKRQSLLVNGKRQYDRHDLGSDHDRMLT